MSFHLHLLIFISIRFVHCFSIFILINNFYIYYSCIIFLASVKSQRSVDVPLLEASSLEQINSIVFVASEAAPDYGWMLCSGILNFASRYERSERPVEWLKVKPTSTALATATSTATATVTLALCSLWRSLC